MNIAVTIWGNRVSPVFDAARTLLVIRMKNKKILSKEYVSLPTHSQDRWAEFFKTTGIDIVICGAISQESVELLAALEIKLISFITGNALDIIETFAQGKILGKKHMMPGCQNNQCRCNEI